MRIVILNPLRPDQVPPGILQLLADAPQIFYDETVPPELLLWSSADSHWKKLTYRRSRSTASPAFDPDALLLTSVPAPTSDLLQPFVRDSSPVLYEAACYPQAGLQGFLRFHAAGKTRRYGWAHRFVHSWSSGMLVMDGATAVHLRPVFRADRDRIWLVEVARHWPRMAPLSHCRRLRTRAPWVAFVWPGEILRHIARRGVAPLVVIPRPWPEAWTMAEKVWAAGSDALPFPVIDFVPGDPAPVAFRRNPNAYQWFIFTSPRGVDYFFQTLRAGKVPHPDPTRVRWAAIGPATEERLHAWGIHTVLRHPTWYQAEGLMECFRDLPLKDSRILIPRAEGRPDLVQYLRGRGATVDEWRIYRTVPMPVRRLRPLVPVLEHASMVVFTSPSTYHHFREILARCLDETYRAAWWQRVLVGAIGPITRDVVLEDGHRVDFMAPQAREEVLVQQVIAYGRQAKRPQPVSPASGSP